MSAPTVHVDPLRTRLPRHAPAMARLSRMLPAMARQAQLDVSLLVSAREPVFVDPARVLIESDAGAALLRVDLASSPALESIAADRDAARRVALANLYLAPWLAALQPAHTGALVVRDLGRDVPHRLNDEPIDADEADRVRRGLSLTLGAEMPCVVDAIAPSLVDALARDHEDTLPPTSATGSDPAAITGRTPGRTPDHIPGTLRGRLHVATRTVRLDVLQSLRPGDVLLGWPLRAPYASDTPDARMEGLSLRWGTAQGVQAHATVSAAGSTLTLHSPLTMIQDTQDFDTASAEPSPPTVDLGPMTVPVRVELVTLELSLDAIAALQPGSIVELPAPLDGAVVQLVCCGNTVASGQLVAVGDNLGVRIVQPVQAPAHGH
ncbi:FliM/FliN family flagellar motor switch protein [Cupriavidus plantarum]|uniref:FliM/FliN family flagellar motor switch protein n=1 Tax=Cupriavidus plantarum TaxID=942865 RepID=UPI0015CCA47B|nr:FliM/FliN family flagellar motor switch protein [Cupriavidus plantarum]NYI00484.1 type III secretion protein Q [Cupriavidus plantarum]